MMSLSARQFKEIEAKIQDKLYDSIKLLTHIYPTSKDFDAVFKRNMFVKSNKAAFQHIIHYLFTVLNPELVKEKITAWPLYDVKLESTFRNEVMALVNHINVEYEYANIPNLMASHLISPGGFKFVKFMLKLATLVIHEHLKKNESIGPELLTRIRPHKDPNVTDIITKNLKTNTGFIVAQIDKEWEEFNTVYGNASQEAQEIVNEQTEIGKELCKANKKVEEKKKTDYNVGSLTEKQRILLEKNAVMGEMKDFCSSGTEMLTFLTSDKPVLHFEKKQYVVPPSLRQQCEAPAELDLQRLFTSLSVSLENDSLELPTFTMDQLNEMRKLLTDLNERYIHLDQKLVSNKNELNDLSANFSPEVTGCQRRKLPSVLSSVNNSSTIML